MSQPQDPNPYARPEPRVSDVNRPVVEEFRANGGRVGGPFEGGDLLLLTTVGARTGREYTTPLGYVRHGDRLLVVGSAGGSPRHPDWYHNLLTHPMVQVEIGTETFGAVAVPAEGAERDRMFEHIVREEPGFGDYQAGVERRLPVVMLERPHVEAGGDEVTNLAEKLVEIHTWLRDQLRHVRAEADAHFASRAAHTGPGDPPVGLGLQIRQHCLAFCESLHFHHTGEDAMLPTLAEQHPHLRDTINRLHAEHQTVARISNELEALLADAATADPERFRTEVDRMTKELEAHLDFEETSLIPVLAEIPFPPGGPGSNGGPGSEGGPDGADGSPPAPAWHRHPVQVAPIAVVGTMTYHTLHDARCLRQHMQLLCLTVSGGAHGGVMSTMSIAKERTSGH